MGIAGCELRDLRCEHLRERVRVRGIGNRQHATHAVDLRSLRRDVRGICGEHDDVDGFRVQCLRRAHALGGGVVEFAVEVFGDDQYLAHSNPFAFSAATSSPTSFTITPRWRFGGAA